MTEIDRKEDDRADAIRESGLPGGGAGRRDKVGRSAVYPAFGPYPEVQVLGGSDPEDRKGLNLSVEIPVEGAILKGDLHIPDDPVGAVLFAHGSGSSRHSPRNQFVARVLQTAGMATLLLDLLTDAEERIDQESGRLRFDVNLLAGRLLDATAWLSKAPELNGVKTGIYGASTGAAAAIIAAAKMPQISTVVSRGGRPDLAGTALQNVKIPVLLIVGGNDLQVLKLNQEAELRLGGERKLEVIQGATHLFEEPGALEQAAQIAKEWFTRLLVPKESTVQTP